MAETTPQAAAPEAAPADVLFSGVFVPAFVKECQALGVPFDPADHEQVQDLLKIAYSLRVRAAAAAEQSASGARDLLKAAAAVLETDTFGGAQAPAAPAAGATAASDFLADASIAKAAEAVAAQK